MGVEKIRRPILGTVLGSDEAPVVSATGWADYVDTAHTDFASGQQISADTWTSALNNGLGGVKSYEPSGVALFEAGAPAGDVITGREGDSLNITTEFNIQRESGNGSFTLLTAYNIGGSVGRLYERTFSLAGNDVQFVIQSTGVYTLDTWATNGALFQVNSTTAIRVFGLRHVIQRVLPAPS